MHSDPHPTMIAPRRRRTLAPWLFCALLGPLAACGGSGPEGGEERPVTVDGASQVAASATAPTASGGVNAAEHRQAPYVVLVSFDGFRWDYLDRYPTPAFRRVARNGVRAERLIPTFPTKTFPTHYSVATGMYADQHGLVGNRFWDPERQEGYSMYDRDQVEDGAWYGGEPIWVTAEIQGMVAASYFFVGSEADVQQVRPTFWNRYDGSVPNGSRVDQVLEWLELPLEERPHMITLYFSTVDDAGHDFGPDAPETEAAVAEVDAALGRLLDGLEALPHGDEVYLVLTSDHGMAWADPDRAHPLDMALLPGVRWAEGGPYASLFVEEGGPERAARVRDSLEALVPESEFWLREEVPERLHYSDDPRVGDIVGLMEVGATVVRPEGVPAEAYWTHGWDNRAMEMGAIFLAQGPGIEPGQRLEAFESVHIYPWMARVLGLEPHAETDGRLEVLGPHLGTGR